MNLGRDLFGFLFVNNITMDFLQSGALYKKADILSTQLLAQQKKKRPGGRELRVPKFSTKAGWREYEGPSLHYPMLTA